MKPSYSDIRDKINEDPIWYDEHGVPRYCEFSPEHISDIHADQVALMEVTCQNCNRVFNVEVTSNPLRGGEDLLVSILDYEDTPIYGDPPAHSIYTDCSSGDTMSSIDEYVLELWSRTGENRKWERFV